MKQILFSLLVFSCFALTAQTKVAPIPIKTEGDLKKEAMIEKAKTQAVTEVAVERTNAKMTFESLTVDFGTIENGSEPLRVVNFTNTVLQVIGTVLAPKEEKAVPQAEPSIIKGN